MEQVGHISVDSGQVLIVDPCYLDDWNNDFDEDKIDEGRDDPEARELNYSGACAATLSDNHCGSVGNLAFGSETGYGDGVYPVYAETDPDGRITMILIDFLPAAGRLQ